MGACAQPIHVGYSPQIPKALTILSGLRFAQDSCLMPCLIEFDAQAVVNLIYSISVPFSEDIRLLLENSPGCCIEFVSRKANMAVHGLAKFNLSIDNVRYCSSGEKLTRTRCNAP
ncbi:hypothetical protein Dsin_031391 [Dipteronia sinensis]|uniref:RNase H type-1 domain-containing protein n=1 Tax=Dipteronia sinensis TaxID=43782 RepID=A0AAD9ZLE5_9ROSI|nr:hypothetical protein Dsin_031391 [Dipteronia sinensis]